MTSVFRPRPRTICPCYRAFSTSTRRTVSLQLDKNDADVVADTVPPYPYGPTRWYKQSRLGLYGGQRIRFGNNVGDKLENKTRRSWHPNVLTRKLFSKALNRHVQIRVTARTLRTIDKLGGLDEYLLGEKEARIKELGESGWWLRWAIMQTPSIRARFAAERKVIGLPEEQVEFAETEVPVAQNVIEEVTEAEAEAAEATGEPVEMDDAFQIEQTPDLPPLKFRVGPHKHIYLTSSGWRRTRPSPTRLEDLAIERIHKVLIEHMLPAREADFLAELKKDQADLPKSQQLSAGERAKMLRSLQKEWKAELHAQAREQFEKKVSLREQRKAERKEAKREGRIREREAKIRENIAEEV